MVEIKKIFLIIDYFHHLSNTSPTQVSSSTSIIAPVVCNIHPYIYIEVGLLKQWLHQPWVENFSSSTSLSSCSSTCCCSGSSATWQTCSALKISRSSANFTITITLLMFLLHLLSYSFLLCILYFLLTPHFANHLIIFTFGLHCMCYYLFTHLWDMFKKHHSNIHPSRPSQPTCICLRTHLRSRRLILSP